MSFTLDDWQSMIGFNWDNDFDSKHHAAWRTNTFKFGFKKGVGWTPVIPLEFDSVADREVPETKTINFRTDTAGGDARIGLDIEIGRDHPLAPLRVFKVPKTQKLTEKYSKWIRTRYRCSTQEEVDELYKSKLDAIQKGKCSFLEINELSSGGAFIVLRERK